MKTILLENGGSGMFRNSTKNWVEKIDPNFIMVNSETREYMKSDDLYTFAMLIDPTLTDLATMSGFPSGMPFEAYRLNGKDFDKYHETKAGNWTQLDWYTEIIYEAVGFRKKRGMPKLTIHIAYEGVDFLKDVNDEDLGEHTKSYLDLMMYQSEGAVELKIYNGKGELLKTITKGSQLKFTR